MPISAATFGYYRPRFTLAQMRAIITACDEAVDYCRLTLDDEHHVQSATEILKRMIGEEND